MNFENLSQSIIKAIHGIADTWLLKSIMAFTITMVTSVHGSALIAFATLVFIDLLTRWLALCYAHLKDCGQNNDLVSCILDVPKAIKDGYINSDAMKHRFIGKIIVYLVLTFMAVKTDELLQLSGETALILKVTWAYLAATEAISVLENLRDAGVEQANGLLDFLRSRATVLLERFKQK